jgi:hypothetical protein
VIPRGTATIDSRRGADGSETAQAGQSGFPRKNYPWPRSTAGESGAVQA